jgi:uncharacterized protein (TIGR00369 family)
MPGDMTPLLNADQLTAHLHAAFPGKPTEARMVVEHLDGDTMRLRFRVDAGDLRPGATVSGPTLFTVADAAAWLLTIAHLGEGRDAVTSSVTIHYLRRPELADLLAEARLLKLGRRTAVTDVVIHSDGAAKPVAQATVTYAPI